jgi:hypothetical protein
MVPIYGIDTGGGCDDSKTKLWPIPPVLAQEESKNRQKAESRDISHPESGTGARARRSILQTALKRTPLWPSRTTPGICNDLTNGSDPVPGKGSYNPSMRRQLAIAVLVAVLAPGSWAQMRGGVRSAGGFRSAAPVGRAGFGVRGPVVGSRGIFVANPSFGIRFHTGFFPGPFFFHNGFRRHGFFFFGGVPWWGSGWGYAGYPLYYSGYSYASDQNAYASANAAYEQNREMQSEINRLTDEIERLRDEQESRYTPTPRPLAENKPEPHEPTTLVFRDQHKQEVENYAIVGQSLWIFNEQKATKIPLSSLDLEATRKVNDQRGIEFQIPK